MGDDARSERSDAVSQGQADSADESGVRPPATSITPAVRDLDGYRPAVENDSSGEFG